MAEKRLCKIPHCNNSAFARGWCVRHYRLWQRHGDPTISKFEKRTEFKNAAALREYKAWSSMKDRCNNPKSQSYDIYGGRGIAVCQRWQVSFDNFLSDMGFRPSPRHSLDRIDSNGNYEPGNCRWATYRVQANNMRSNRWITINGEPRTVSQWCRYFGIANSTVYSRVARGESLLDAITKPVKK